MVKIIFMPLLFTIGSFANNFESDCLKCHKQSAIPMDMIYKRYLLEFSSHEDMKRAMVNFLKNPTKQKSMLPKGLLMGMSIKEKSNLSDKQLEDRIDEYLKIYDIKKRIVPGRPTI